MAPDRGGYQQAGVYLAEWLFCCQAPATAVGSRLQLSSVESSQRCNVSNATMACWSACGRRVCSVRPRRCVRYSALRHSPSSAPYQRGIAATRLHLDAATFAAVWAAGRVLTLNQEIKEALTITQEAN